jgi:ribosomal protein L37AE/L43A
MTWDSGYHNWQVYSVLTAAQMNQISKNVEELYRKAIIPKVCPFCGTSTHHKGFREWEECDGCAAEWRMG